MNINVEIASDSNLWTKSQKIDEELFADLIIRILPKCFSLPIVNLKEIELSVLLTDDRHIQQLNKNFRKKDKPTNVLSFPDNEFDWRESLELQPGYNYIYLGDIAFSYNTIDKESQEATKKFNHHFTHLAVHSILHLLGYNHDNSGEAEVMENIEVEILKELGIASPY